jgi:hypothetical protein
MNWQEMVEQAFRLFSRGSGSEARSDEPSYYVDVPVDLTLNQLTSNDAEDHFHEVHESPFQLFTKEGRTTLLAPSLAILVGQYGMGKTSFVQQLCGRLRAKGHIPFPINLADSRQAYGSDSFIEGSIEPKMVDFLFSSLAREQPDPATFLEKVRTELVPQIHNGRVILILDSLDELGLNRQKLQKFMQALAGFLMPSKPEEPFVSRALVAVRLEYLAAFGMEDADSLLGKELSQMLTVYFLKLSAFSESRIQSYLERRNKPEVASELAAAPSLRDILVRPLFLRIFCDLAPTLLKKDLKHLRSPTLLIQSFIQHASEDARRQVRKPFKWDEEGLSAMALHLYNTGELDIPIEKVRSDLIRSSNISVDEAWQAIHKCPFLRKNTESRVRFSHRVFIEYFTAKALAKEAARGEELSSNAFDTIVLDVDTRKFLKDLYGDKNEWYERTRKSYGLDEDSGWNISDEMKSVDGELDQIRRKLLDYMTTPELVSADKIRPVIHHFLTLDAKGLHPCYRMYNYEAVAVFLWHNRKDEEDQKLSTHFETLLTQRLDEANKHLHQDEPLRPHYERLVERILSIGERLRYEQLSRFNKKKILEKIEEPDTRARIRHIVAGA